LIQVDKQEDSIGAIAINSSKRARSAVASERAFLLRMSPFCIKLERRLSVVPEAGRCIADADGTDIHSVTDENGCFI
jgi:hypothetical protein